MITRFLTTALGAALLFAGGASAQIETARFDDSAFALGTLTPSSGALPDDLWEGAEAETIAALLALTPDRFAEPAFQRLAMRALLSPGQGPQGTDNALGGAKLMAAAELGYYREAAELARVNRGLAREPALSRVIAFAHLMDGEFDEACARGQALQSGRSDPFWLRLRFFCYARAGERAAADLTLNLLRDQDLLDDADLRYFSALAGGAAASGPAIPRSAFQYAVARSLGLSMGADALADAGGSVVAAMARDAEVDPAVRARAIEQALTLGLVEAREARSLIEALPASDLAEALVTVETYPQGSIDRTAAIAEALRDAGDWSGFEARAALFATAIAEARPVENYAPDGDVLALAAMTNGNVEAARRWLDALEGDASDPASGDRHAAMMPLLAVLTGEAGAPPAILADAAAATDSDVAGIVRPALAAARSGSRGAGALAALAALGVPAEGDARPIREAIVAEMLAQADAGTAARLAFDAAAADLAATMIGGGEGRTGEPSPRLKPAP